MASPTVFMHLGAWSQLLPTVAALGRQSGIAAHGWIAAGCFTSALGDALMLLLALRGMNNHWVGYTSTPLTGAMFLWALAFWQVSLVERLTVRLIVPAYLLAWLVLALLTEDRTSFSRFAMPLHALLLLATALWTLLRRGMGPAEQPHLGSDWFWIAGGLAVYSAATLTFGPVAAALVSTRPDLVIAALNIRAVVSFFAFLAIAWGIWCSSPAKVSGLSSSPQRLG